MNELLNFAQPNASQNVGRLRQTGSHTVTCVLGIWTKPHLLNEYSSLRSGGVSDALLYYVTGKLVLRQLQHRSPHSVHDLTLLLSLAVLCNTNTPYNHNALIVTCREEYYLHFYGREISFSIIGRAFTAVIFYSRMATH